MQTLEERFDALAASDWPTGPHLRTLRRYAEQANEAVEFGTGSGVSTVALLAAQPRRLTTYDVAVCDYAHELSMLAGRTEYAVVRASSLDVPPVQCDLLFIDSMHNGRHLWRELHRHGNGVRRWIILHDTAGFAIWDEETQEPGLWPAMWKWKKTHPEWKTVYRTRESWGLTVWERTP
jgi:hypothetical protein